MLILSLLVGLTVAICLSWIVFIVSYLLQGRINASYIIVLMGLFLPLVVMGLSFYFIYILAEMKKTQQMIKQLAQCVMMQRNTKKIVTAHNTDTQNTVVSISMDEPISKYEDVQLPENASLRFEK